MADINNVCQNFICDQNCKKCFGTSTNCTACSAPLFLQNNTCLTICSLGYFGRKSDQTCQKSCDSGYFSLSVDRICYQTCPQVYFPEQTLMKCLSICPTGEFNDFKLNGGVCMLCDFNCGDCVGFSTNCSNFCKYDFLINGLNCSNPSSLFFF